MTDMAAASDTALYVLSFTIVGHLVAFLVKSPKQSMADLESRLNKLEEKYNAMATVSEGRHGNMTATLASLDSMLRNLDRKFDAFMEERRKEHHGTHR